MQLFFDMCNMYTSMCGDDDNARNDGTTIGRFIKLSAATVYTVSGKIFIIYIAFSKISKIMPKTGKPYSGLAPKIPRAHTFFYKYNIFISIYYGILISISSYM